MDISKQSGWSAPFYLMAAYIGFALLRPHEYELSPITDLPVLPVLLVTGLLAWLVYGRKQFSAPQFYLAPLLLILMCISMIAGGWAGGAPAVLRKFLPVIGVFFLVASTVDSIDRQRLIFKIVAVMVTIMAWHGITQVETGTGWSGAQVLNGRITYVGIFNDPNDLGLLFIASIPLILFLMYSSESLLLRLLLLASLGSIMYGVYLTNSRGTILGLIATTGLYVWSRFGFWKAALLGALGLPVLLIIGPSRLTEGSGSDGIDESAFYRLEAWYQGLQLWLSHPVFGIGPERFSDYFFMNAHNSFIIVLAELGFIGAFVWVSFVVLSLYMMYQLQRPELAKQAGIVADEQFRRAQTLAKALMFSLLAFLAAAFFLSRTFDITLFILCGLCVAHYQTSRNLWPAIPMVRLTSNLMRIFSAMAVVIGMTYIAMKIGLSLG